jgi:P-type E1-E2 ATPase
VIELNIPGHAPIQLKHLVTDVNGTLALDGRLLPGVAKPLLALSDRLEIHLLTADTHGGQAQIDSQLGLVGHRIEPHHEVEAKAGFVRELEGDVFAIGQGANDAGMLAAAAIGVAVMSDEGLAAETLAAADLLMPNVTTALMLLEQPMRLVASLRR